MAYKPKTRHVSVFVWQFPEGPQILGVTPSTLDATWTDEVVWDIVGNVEDKDVQILFENSPLDPAEGVPGGKAKKHGGRTKVHKIKDKVGGPQKGSYAYKITVAADTMDPEIRIRDEDECP